MKNQVNQRITMNDAEILFISAIGGLFIYINQLKTCKYMAEHGFIA
jgi:DUF2075 family protein